MNAAARRFRELHDASSPLVLANAWDAGSARLIESCGAAAVATTSAGLAWSRGHADGDRLPPRVLAGAVTEIARAISVPLSVDVEGGYAEDPRAVAEHVRAVLDAGAVGINLEDGAGEPKLLCAKIAAVKSLAAAAGMDVFVNARCDVYLRGLVPATDALAETLTRARLYREAGCDGFFAPKLAAAESIAALARALGDLPLNVMVVPGLPTVAELGRLGVRRVSAGSAIAQLAYGAAREAIAQMLRDGRYDRTLDGPRTEYEEMNALLDA